MLQAHSILWHYLWVSPNVLLLLLAFLMYQRGLHREYPSFFAFSILASIVQLTIYVADVSPAISAGIWWRLFWVGLLLEGVLKFFLIGEIFDRTFRAYRSVARLSRILVRGVGAALILGSALLAALAPQDGRFSIVSGAHVLEEGIYLVETGLLAFVFLLASQFKLRLPSRIFGIALGLSISACVHLASWAVMANGGLPDSKRVLFVFLNMATYHACVLIWFYYLLVPKSVYENTVPSTRPPDGLNPLAGTAPEGDLELWNRELERLIHQ